MISKAPDPLRQKIMQELYQAFRSQEYQYVQSYEEDQSKASEDIVLDGHFNLERIVDVVLAICDCEKRNAVEEFLELASGHYWDSLANDTPIIREHLKAIQTMMFPPTP